MAINRAARENLMRDATAYTRRLMLRSAQSNEGIFIGLRQQGGWSIYFGEDPVYQFNDQCKVRRVHCANQSYAASDGKLYWLQRNQLGGRVEIQRTYSADTERRLLADCLKCLQELAASMLSNSVEIVERLPVDDREIVEDVAKMIRKTVQHLEIANVANA